MPRYELRTRRLFFDWHMPEFLPEVRLDVERLVDKAVEIGAQSIDFMCKSAFGNCLYPSEVGRTNRVMVGDIFGDLCRLAHERGLEVIAYYNMLLNDSLGAERPEWLQVDQQGNSVRFESYRMFCMNTPYREHAFAHLREIAGRFAVDGFSLDLQYFHPAGCFCPWCREGFEKEHGYPLAPEQFTQREEWIALNAFQRRTREDFILEAMRQVEEVRPGVAWTWNHSGSFGDFQRLDAQASFLSGEAHPPDYMPCATKAKWMQSSGKPFQFWMPESIGSWGHWTISTPGTLKGTVALALAHGGSIAFNHVAPPCGDYAGQVFDGVYRVFEDLFSWIREREAVCVGKQSLPVVAVLHSAANYSLFGAARLAAANASPGTNPFTDQGLGTQANFDAVHLLMASHLPCDFFYSEDSMERLEEYEAVVLPNTGYVDDALADRLRAYVDGGGRLIATYTTSLLDATGAPAENFALADLFGADFVRRSDYSVVYLDQFEGSFGRGLPGMPLLVKDVGYQRNSPHKALYCAPRPGAQAHAFLTEPALESDWAAGRHVYHDHAPPATRTEWPAILTHRYGRGICALFPFPLLRAYGFLPNPWLRQVFKNTLAFMGVPRKLRVQAPPAIYLAAAQDAEGWLLHLVKVQKETDSMFLDETAPTAPVRVEARPPWPASGVERALTGEALECRNEGDRITFVVPGVVDHEIVRVRRSI